MNSILVNGRWVTITAKELTYKDIITLAYPTINPTAILSVTCHYKTSRAAGRDRIVAPGQAAVVCAGMSLEIADTSAA